MYFRDKFSILRSILVSDGIGGNSETLVVSRSDVRGYVRDLSNEEQVLNAQMNKMSTFRLYCSDVSVTISDTLSILRYGDTVSHTYEIEGIDQKRDLGSGHKKNMVLSIYVQGDK